MGGWAVLVRSRDSGGVVVEVECDSEREAKRVEDDMNFHLDHEALYTEIDGPRQ